MKKQEADSAIGAWAKKLKVEEYMQMPAEKLSKGNQQKIQFMTSVIHNPELIVLDEPTSSLSEREVKRLFKILRDLRAKGISFIFISHKMDEIFELCDSLGKYDLSHIRAYAQKNLERKF